MIDGQFTPKILSKVEDKRGKDGFRTFHRRAFEHFFCLYAYEPYDFGDFDLQFKIFGLEQVKPKFDYPDYPTLVNHPRVVNSSQKITLNFIHFDMIHFLCYF